MTVRSGIIVVSIFGLTMSVTTWGQASIRRTEVAKAWEALVNAKGGRTRLSEIYNMLTEYDGMTRLAVFPNKEWEGAAPFFGNRYARLFDRERKLSVTATRGDRCLMSSKPGSAH
jgi:hypothetical protein